MPANTTVNGNSYSFVQIETTVGVLPIASIKDISYDDDLRRADQFGTASVQLGLTRGTYKAQGSIELYMRAFVVAIVNQYGPGWRQVQTSLSVTYGPDDSGLVVTDILPAILWGKLEGSHSYSDEGPPLTRKLGMYVPSPILWNGVPSIIETFPLIAVA